MSFTVNLNSEMEFKYGEKMKVGGENGDRTHDLCIANAALSQLSYFPTDSETFVILH